MKNAHIQLQHNTENIETNTLTSYTGLQKKTEKMEFKKLTYIECHNKKYQDILVQ